VTVREKLKKAIESGSSRAISEAVDSWLAGLTQSGSGTAFTGWESVSWRRICEARELREANSRLFF